MTEGKSTKERMPYEKPSVVFKSALEAYAQSCLGPDKAKAANVPGVPDCEGPQFS